MNRQSISEWILSAASFCFHRKTLALVQSALVLSFYLPEQAKAIELPDNREIEEVILSYYDAMTRGDAELLRKVLHDKWHLKTLAGNPDDPMLVGGKAEYIKMYDGVLQPDYSKDRHITSIDVAKNSLAIIRIDSPGRDHTVFFTLVKISGQWYMTEKAFISASEAERFSKE